MRIMEHQDIANLFRRFKGQTVNVKTTSGGIYEGRVSEIADGFVCLSEADGADVYLFFTAIESMLSASGTAR